MPMRTQSAKQDVTKAEDWGKIKTLIRETAATEHVSFACSYCNVFDKAHGCARNDVVGLL